jgi:hypothetical protein
LGTIWGYQEGSCEGEQAPKEWWSVEINKNQGSGQAKGSQVCPLSPAVHSVAARAASYSYPYCLHCKPRFLEAGAKSWAKVHLPSSWVGEHWMW